MKMKTLISPLVLLIILLTACSNSSKVYDLATITQLFEEAELHLKPQAGDSYPIVMSIEPRVYELLDDSLYIYVFKAEDDLAEALKSVHIEDLFNVPPYVYQLNNILILYMPLSPTDVNFEKQIHDIIHNEQAQK
ncbi:hypothetical protein [Paenibacillus paeoniae]|uniref:Lipoprotein n=1 Tax=Paenibacillus paeoniae TaxID=2292705 RepID=A0A371P5V9_9BACL|nr:hypothetical protein [Paenibacillus paeoniae]REK71321.1 hypothetical protein DX130_23070 [Paenibacillus paeoniae]